MSLNRCPQTPFLHTFISRLACYTCFCYQLYLESLNFKSLTWDFKGKPHAECETGIHADPQPGRSRNIIFQDVEKESLRATSDSLDWWQQCRKSEWPVEFAMTKKMILKTKTLLSVYEQWQFTTYKTSLQSEAPGSLWWKWSWYFKSCPTLYHPTARQAPLSMGFPRQEYWSGLPFPSPGDLPDPRIKPRSPAWQVIPYSWATWEGVYMAYWP